jgi:hypothetical protein
MRVSVRKLSISPRSGSGEWLISNRRIIGYFLPVKRGVPIGNFLFGPRQ